MATALTVGVAVPDLSEYTAIDPSWGIGDPRLQVEAAAQGLRAAGRLPVHGRDIGFVFERYRSNQSDEKVAAARRLAAAGPVAVLGGRDFTEGALWLARHGVPVIDVNAVPRATFEDTGPYLFTLRTAQDELYRGFVRWAANGGRLDGRTIGVFSDRLTRQATAAALEQLEQAGHPAHAVVHSEGRGVGSEQDDSVPVRFRADGVDLVLGFVGGSSWIATLRAAAAIGFHPSLLDLETGEHTNDVTARCLPPDLYDGTEAVAMSRVGDVAAGWPLAPATEQAVAAYEMHSGTRLDRSVPIRTGEWSNTLISADLVSLLAEGLERAGSDPTSDALVSALETVSSLPMASGADVTFRPGEHWGFRGLRTIRWNAARATWVAEADFQPLDSL